VTYAEVLARLFALRRFGVRPGLGPMQAAMAALGHPGRAFPAIHVAGTNGKGSTAAMCEAALRQAGRRTGLYTSPHLSRFTERVRLDGQEIGGAEIAALVDEVLGCGVELTFFEVVTCAAFLAFARGGVEVAIVECGLGGRLDATNVLPRSLVSIITTISLEHTDVLGQTIAAIAFEKAGILRSGVPAVIGRVDAEAARAIATVADDVGAPLAWLGRDFEAELEAPGLLGGHQQDNAAVARAALLRLPSPLRPADGAIAEGLRSARWPGRLERLADDLVVDGAHNPAGTSALAAALPKLAGGRPVRLVLGVVEDKDARLLAAPLLPLCEQVIATRAPSPRALPAAALLDALGGPGGGRVAIEDPLEALAAARRPGTLTIVAGSLFLVGAVRAHVLGEPIDPLAVQDPAAGPRRENL
jgi:dihydrofolate synthase / folylpolyglutamate synthase